MKHHILLDKKALHECISNNIYQNLHFSAGENLAKALGGDTSCTQISPHLAAEWIKNTLYLLKERSNTSYFLGCVVNRFVLYYANVKKGCRENGECIRTT